ncbi:hypothetical protein ACFVWZ_34030 [Streptomyces sp. NPDC058200]|uniref:hypothetical protein n=1 Tax=Streptomyces sp. NPDC058200 TaxID=3346378 RepID=UPI0036EC3032
MRTPLPYAYTLVAGHLVALADSQSVVRVPRLLNTSWGLGPSADGPSSHAVSEGSGVANSALLAARREPAHSEAGGSRRSSRWATEAGASRRASGRGSHGTIANPS